MIDREFIRSNEEIKSEILISEEFRKLEKFKINHFFTTLNFGHIDIDDPESYKKIYKTLSVSPKRLAKIVFAGQPHGNKICFVDGSQSIILGYDGLFTNKENVVLVIRTADCLPILIAGINDHPNKKIIGALHAGRKGLVDGIVNNSLNFLKEEGFNLNNVYFLIGPHICGKCYSLDKDNEQTINLVNKIGEKYFNFNINEGKVFLDLYALARDQLTEEGVPEENIYHIPICTYEQPSLFPSYRFSAHQNNVKNSLFGSVIYIKK
jgi:YfiH family protein